MKIVKLITHNGSFHADDIFATATLELMLDKKGVTYEVTRTRDIDIINAGDYVYDVGGIYDADTNRFDHHQIGGAGKHLDGVEYAAFGLVWKKYGEEVSGSKEVADYLEAKLVEPVDANDNGMNLIEAKSDILPFTVQDIFMVFRPTWKEEENYDEPFFELVQFAKKIIVRSIKRTQDALIADESVEKAYAASSDKRIIILEGGYPWHETLEKYEEPMFVVFPKSDTWRVEGVRSKKNSFDLRKKLPESWGGHRDQDFQNISGVADATFCHRALFMAVAQSKEGAIKLAQIALES